MPNSLDPGGGTIQILRNWEEIAFVQLFLVLAVAGVLILVVTRSLPWLAGKLPARFRFYILPWSPLLRLLIILLAIVLCTPLVVEPSAGAILAVLGTIGVALGFAFKDYVSSLIAGVVVLFEQPYRAGDWVRIGDEYGEVQSLGLRAVELVTPDDDVVAIPHAKIWDSAVRNANAGQRELQCSADFYLLPDHDGEAVREKLRDVALTSPYLQLGRPVAVVVREEPWATHYRLKAYPIDGRDQFRFTSDLTLRAKAALARIGVQPATLPPALETS